MLDNKEVDQIKADKNYAISALMMANSAYTVQNDILAQIHLRDLIAGTIGYEDLASNLMVNEKVLFDAFNNVVVELPRITIISVMVYIANYLDVKLPLNKTGGYHLYLKGSSTKNKGGEKTEDYQIKSEEIRTKVFDNNETPVDEGAVKVSVDINNALTDRTNEELYVGGKKENKGYVDIAPYENRFAKIKENIDKKEDEMKIPVGYKLTDLNGDVGVICQTHEEKEPLLTETPALKEVEDIKESPLLTELNFRTMDNAELNKIVDTVSDHNKSYTYKGNNEKEFFRGHLFVNGKLNLEKFLNFKEIKDSFSFLQSSNLAFFYKKYSIRPFKQNENLEYSNIEKHFREENFLSDFIGWELGVFSTNFPGDNKYKIEEISSVINKLESIEFTGLDIDKTASKLYLFDNTIRDFSGFYPNAASVNLLEQAVRFFYLSEEIKNVLNDIETNKDNYKRPPKFYVTQVPFSATAKERFLAELKDRQKWLKYFTEEIIAVRTNIVDYINLKKSEVKDIEHAYQLLKANKA